MEELAELMTDEAALHQEEQQVFSPELHQDFWFPSDNAGILDCDQAPSSASYYSLQIPPVHIPEMKRSLVNNQQLLSLPNWAPTPLIDTLDLSVTPEIHVTRQPPKVSVCQHKLPRMILLKHFHVTLFRCIEQDTRKRHHKLLKGC
jgi:hypothetical protein